MLAQEKAVSFLVFGGLYPSTRAICTTILSLIGANNKDKKIHHHINNVYHIVPAFFRFINEPFFHSEFSKILLNN